jgi:hypothetical protein
MTAKSKEYVFHALPRSKKVEYADYVLAAGNLLQEVGDILLTEDSANLILEGGVDLRLSYALLAKSHDRNLIALRRFDLPPAWEVVEGNLLLEDGDAFLQEDGTSTIIYTDIRGN